MKTNWLDYLDDLFSNLNLKFERKINDSNLFVTYCINEIYFQFEFKNSTYLNKIEIWKEKANLRSNYKIIFDQKKSPHFHIKQNCFEINRNINFEIEFNDTNKENVNIFLKTIIEKGWKEIIYKYEETEYQNEIIIENKSYKISLKSNLEQDVPFLLSSLLRKIEDLWFNLNLKSKKKIIVNQIKPL